MDYIELWIFYAATRCPEPASPGPHWSRSAIWSWSLPQARCDQGLKRVVKVLGCARWLQSTRQTRRNRDI